MSRGAFRPEHRCLGLADHLDAAERVLEALDARRIIIVEPERLLVLGRVRLLSTSPARLAVVEHVVAPDLVGAVGQSARGALARRVEQQRGRVGRPAGDDDDASAVMSRFSPSALDEHLRTVVPAALVFSSSPGVASSVTFGCSSAGCTAITSASDLACTRHGNRRSPAADAAAVGMLASLSRTPQGAWKGW